MPECSASQLAIGADLAQAVLYSATSAVMLDDLRDPDTPEGLRESDRHLLAFFGTLVIVDLASAVYGYWQRDRCSDARAAHDGWLAEQAWGRQWRGPPGTDGGNPTLTPPGTEVSPGRTLEGGE